MSCSAGESRAASSDRNGVWAAGALILSLACGSCATRPLQGMLVPNAETAGGTSRVPILVATTRAQATGDAGQMFSGERADAMSYARIDVSIPPDDARTVGQIQWPSAPPGDPKRDFVTVSAQS